MTGVFGGVIRKLMMAAGDSVRCGSVLMRR